MATILGSLLGVSIVKAQQVWYDAGIFLTTAEVLLGTEKKRPDPGFVPHMLLN